MGLIAFLILLPIVVFVHELGHFLFARLTGVKVEAFSIGFGKSLLSWKDKHGTEWKISMIPLGGYVKLFGQSDLPETPEKREAYFKKLTKKQKAENFEFKNRFQKSLIVAAGAFFNFIFGFLVFAMLFFFIGKANMSSIVSEVQKDTPAFTAGIKEGDKIIAINGLNVEDPRKISKAIQDSKGEKLNIEIQRDKKNINVFATPKQDGDRYIIGILYGSKFENYEKVDFSKSIEMAYNDTKTIITGTLKSLGEIFTGSRSSKELGGMISIAKVGGEALSNGFYSFLYLIALISISLGLFNLFPIPVLDGGYLFIYLIETVIRRPLSDKVKQTMFFIGFLFIIFLLLLSNINDIIRLFN